LLATANAVAASSLLPASTAFAVANKQIQKFVSKGILKKETAARKISRLNKAVNAI
jgi:small subunit ribosomal protein S20